MTTTAPAPGPMPTAPARRPVTAHATAESSTNSTVPTVDIDRLATGRDRVIDLARAVSMAAVALGHWVVTDVYPAANGGLALSDALAELPQLQALTWLFQVMPVFFFAGGVVGFRSWQRHHDAGRPGGVWVARRLWRLAWPTLPVVGFWVVVTQVGDHLLGLPVKVLAASRGIALIVWFLAVYAIVVALIPALARALARWRLWVPASMLASAGMVDLAVARLGHVPPWSLVNYLLVWGAITCLGWWWPQTARPGHRRVGLVVAGIALAALSGAVVAGLYPLSMVGVNGTARSNSWPPTLALALLGMVQVGLLVAARPKLDAWLAVTSRYRVVASFGARAMTIYLWHPLAQAVLAVGLVLSGVWPTASVGSVSWWGLRLAWVVACLAITIPVVAVVGRWERPVDLRLTRSSGAATVAAVALATAWIALALQGFHVSVLPLGLPLVALSGLGFGLAALQWQDAREPVRS